VALAVALLLGAGCGLDVAEPDLLLDGAVLGTVAGRVAFSDGIGLEGVRIHMSDGSRVLTDSTGHYVLAEVPPGQYTILALPSLGYVIVPFTSSEKNITVSAGATTEVNWTVREG